MRAAINLANLFRGLIVLILVTHVGASVAFFALHPQLAPPDNWLHRWHFAGKSSILAIVLIAYFASSIALLFFKWRARFVYTILVIANWIDTIVSLGDQRSSSLVYLDGIEAILEIAVIALMWASPLTERFRKPPFVEPPPATLLPERTFQWPLSGRIALASIASVIVATVCVLPPTVGVFVVRMAAQIGWANMMQDYVMLFTVSDLVMQQALHLAAFWVLISFLLFPTIRFGLKPPAVWSRWASAAMGVAVPYLLLLAIEALSPQFKPLEFYITPICCGIPAALVFGEIVGYERSDAISTIRPWYRTGRSVAVALSGLAAVFLGLIGLQAWSGAAQAFPLKAEWQYRWHHPTWPVWCSSMSNLRLFPRLDPTAEDDNAICKGFAERGDAVAQYMLAQGDFGRIEPAERLAWLTKSAEQDFGPAASALGSMLGPFSKDQGVPKDADKAAQWELRAAILGDTVARAMVAVFYSKGDRGLPLDNVASLMWRELTFRNKDGFLGKEGLRDNYEKFAAKMPPELVAEGHRRAEEFLATH
jgi:hypothetical protein